jgi:LysR family carnitine catabolism transcriptional activator
MNITLRQLQAFVWVVKTGKFTLAAQKMHITQSALSTLIKELEAGVAVRLLDRHTRKVEMTEAGTGFYAMAERTLGDIENAVANAHDLATLKTGRVSLVASTVMSAGLLPAVLREFKALFPNVKIELHDVAEEEIMNVVRSGRVDMGIGTSVGVDSEIDEVKLLDDRFIALCDENHPLVKKRRITWHDLQGFPFVALAPASPIRQLIDQTMREANATFDIAYEVSFATTVLSLVGAGLGVSILPMNNHPYLPAFRIHAREVTSPTVTRKISVLTRAQRSLSPAASQFLAFLQQYIARRPGLMSAGIER